MKGTFMYLKAIVNVFSFVIESLKPERPYFKIFMMDILWLIAYKDSLLIFKAKMCEIEVNKLKSILGD